MANMDDVNQKVRELVRVLLAMPEDSVRKADQNAPTGGVDEQFATVRIMLNARRGWDARRSRDLPAPSTAIEETVVGQRRFTASVQFFRGDAYTKACRLETVLQSSTAIAKMQEAGLGLVRMTPAKNLTATVGALWEERGQIDIEFHLIADEIYELPTYGEATFNLAVAAPGESDPGQIESFTVNLDFNA